MLRIRSNKNSTNTAIRIRLLNQMTKIPDNMACLTPCKAELEQIRNNFVHHKTCDDLHIADKTFVNCYIRERRISPPSFLEERPVDFFLTRNALDVAVLTCYVHRHYYYHTNSKNHRDKVIYSDCFSKGGHINLIIHVCVVDKDEL